jgi:hypothetical protein
LPRPRRASKRVENKKKPAKGHYQATKSAK